MKSHRLIIGSAWLAIAGGAAGALVACGGDTIGETIIVDGGGTTVEGDATVIGGDGSVIVNDGSTIVLTTPDASGDDDASTDAGASDASADADASFDAGALDGGALITLYAGLSATLTAPASDTGAASFAWTLVSAPAGSTITSASIANATTANALLPTDVPGTYIVSLAVGGVAQAETFTVIAAPAHLLYVIGNVDAGGGDASTGLSVIDSDGTNGHAVICPFVGSNHVAAGALGSVDVVEGAPGTPSKVVFGSPPVNDGGGGVYARLYITDTSGTCPAGGKDGDNATLLVQTNGAVIAGVAVGSVSHPRVSPDGTKIAFTVGTTLNVLGEDTTTTVGVVNVDGTSVQSLGTLGEPTAANSDETQYAAVLRQPEWTTDSTRVGWMRAEGSGTGGANTQTYAGWKMVTSAVPATTGTDPALYISCPSAQSTPTRGVFLADGTVLTAYQAVAKGPVDLVRLAAPATPTGSATCSVVTNYSNLTAPQAVTAFALSPDAKTVAFSVASSTPSIGTQASGSIEIASVDGTVAAHPVGSASVTTTDIDNGLRWVAGGSQLAFTHTNDAGVGAVATIWALGDAAVVLDVTSPDAGSGQTYIAAGDGDGNGCSFGGKSTPFLGFFGGALALLGIARRRQRAARKG